MESRASVVTVSGESAVLQLDFPANTAVTVPGFKPALSCRGPANTVQEDVLVGTTVTLTSHLATQGDIGLPVGSGAAATTGATISGPFTLTTPGGTLTATPSISYPPMQIPAGGHYTLEPRGAVAIATASGGNTGWNSPTVQLPVSTRVVSELTGPQAGPVTFTLQSFGLVMVDVTYFSECASLIIPESHFYGIAGALVSLITAGLRCLRRARGPE